MSLASFVVNANTASSTPVRRAPFVARVRLAAEAAAARPDGHCCQIRCRGEAPSLSLASSIADATAAASLSPVRWAAIVARASLAANGHCLAVVTWAPTRPPLFRAIRAPWPHSRALQRRPLLRRRVCRVRTPSGANVRLNRASGSHRCAHASRQRLLPRRRRRRRSPRTCASQPSPLPR